MAVAFAPHRNRTNFRPARQVFTGGRLTSIGFLGIPEVGHNPGLPSGDPSWQTQLIREFWYENWIAYKENTHNGLIGHVGATGIIQGDDFSIEIPYSSAPMAVQADAIVVNYGHHSRPPTVVGRTWDCQDLVMVNAREHLFAIVHGSINTLFGYAVNQFRGPIIDRTLAHLGNLRDIHIACGPCMGGLVSPHTRCWCYEFGSQDADTLFNLVTTLYPRVSLEGLTRSRPDTQKTDIAFGELIVRVLKSLGLDRRGQIDTSCNFCTGCYHQFYSNRRVRQRINQLEALALTRPLTEEEAEELTHHRHHIVARYGNLAYAIVS